MWVKSGFVRLFKENRDKKETTLPVLKSAFHFSLMNVLTGEKYKLQAINNIEVYTAPANDFMDFINENEEIKMDLYKSIAYYNESNC